MKHFWLGLLLIGAVSGCGWTKPDTTNPVPTVTVTKTVQAPVEHWEPEEKEFDLRFGETYQFGHEGLAFAVSHPKPVSVANPKGQKYKNFIEFTVKMTNISKYEWKDVVIPVNVTVDSNSGIQYSGDYPANLAGGKSVDMKFIFNVADYNNTVQVEIMPDFVAPITWG